jgi:hypothetical protein
MPSLTFIIDCPHCKAKVAAEEKGRAEQSGMDEEEGPWAHRIYVGSCPRCRTLIAGESVQLDFEGVDAEEDRWSDVIRVYPKPSKSFSSNRIPRVVTDSFLEADRSLQANANIAACVMLGRGLEALCRDLVADDEAKKGSTPSSKKLMLGEGIRQLRDRKLIDERLFDWSQQLQAFRNLAAHPEDISISREDAGDLQTFAYAIVEYVYDLTDRYAEFKARAEVRSKRKKA